MFRFKPLFSAAVAVFFMLGASSLARAEDFPNGTFAQTIQDMKITIKFDKDKYTVTFAGEVGVEGKYKAAKDQIEFLDAKGKFTAKEDEKKVGKYKWKLDGKKLTFTKIEDEVEGRAMGLTSGAWTKE
jgi:hypothetical protein